ncbi:MAG: hypothetical protein HZB39_05685 [Planctomycetes bacterium]|nr:hypothetical protein [Planctomycetota bacterium]
MTFTVRLLLALAVLSLALAGACSSSTQLAADGVSPDDESLRFREVFADDLRGSVQLEAPVTRRNDQNLLELRVPIRNILSRDLRVTVQVKFIDESGAPSGDETNLQYLILPRGSTKTFVAISRTSSARGYKLYLWRAEK